MPRIKTPTRRKMLRAEVARVVRTSPSFTTITVQGPDLDDFEGMGADQFVRLFFRREGQTELAMPTAAHNGWLAQYMVMRAANKPWVRNYTVRALRPEVRELDVEFVMHGDASPASAFASRAQPGDPVGLFDEGIAYTPPESARRQLLVADESAVPALLAILENAPADLLGQAYLEVPLSDDIRSVSAPEGVTVHWLPRDGGEGIPGRRALDTVTSHLPELPTDGLYCWVAGESGLATGLRRLLVREYGVPKSDVAFIGYWKHGRGSPG